MKISELTEEQLEKIADKNPFWLAENHPKWMAENHPEWMADRQSSLMVELRPRWMAGHRPDLMVSIRPRWMLDYEPKWMQKHFPEMYNKYVLSLEQEVPEEIEILVDSEEGDICGKNGCDGILGFQLGTYTVNSENLQSKHTVEAKLVCKKCGREIQ